MDASYSRTTNDLTLPLRLYNLRRQYSANAIVRAELDRTFTNLVSGNLPAARMQLSGLEARQPVIYNLSLTNNTLRFVVGGYVSPNGAEIQTTSNLASAWTTASTLTVGTNAIQFTSPVSPQSPPAFFKVRTTQP